MHFKLLLLSAVGRAAASLPSALVASKLGNVDMALAWKRPSTQGDPGKPGYHPLTLLFGSQPYALEISTRQRKRARTHGASRNVQTLGN